jgi:hypothetical protein
LSARLPTLNSTPAAIGPSLSRNGTPPNGPLSSCASGASNSGCANPCSTASALASAVRATACTSTALTSPRAISSRTPAASNRVYAASSTGGTVTATGRASQRISGDRDRSY